MPPTITPRPSPVSENERNQAPETTDDLRAASLQTGESTPVGRMPVSSRAARTESDDPRSERT
jgi:hypothetical protein